MSRIVVSGALANKPLNGGAAWTRMSWVLGLAELGHTVHFIEQIGRSTCVTRAGLPCDLDASMNRAYFDTVTESFGLHDRALLLPSDAPPDHPDMQRAAAIASEADALINISGHLTLPDVTRAFRSRVFIDLDPGYTQYWLDAGLDTNRLANHDAYFTVGLNIGTEYCSIPTGGIDWHPVRQPVVLREWPVTPALHTDRFTTIASWRGPYGRVPHEGGAFGLKAHEFRKVLDLPCGSSGTFEIALDIDRADDVDAARMRERGWSLVDPHDSVSTPQQFRQYVQGSGAEFSVAQGIYVETGSGWFSDRTVRYLASGRPALVQDTGYTRTLPSGVGLVPFRTLEEARAGVEHITRHYATHSAAARAIAEEYFDCRKVLPAVLRAAGITS